MRNTGKKFWLITVLAVSWMLVMRPYTPNNIVAFELAKVPERALAILSEWGAAGIAKARLSIYLDFGFLILYSWSISLGCNIAGKFSMQPKLIAIGSFLAKLVWLAGLFDVLENGTMLITLNEVYDTMPAITFYCAVTKFALLAIAMVYIVLAALVGLLNLLLRTKNKEH
ncbi:hypothetical protein [Pedobacter endophyticus]|uniref:Uncharacterized protein n=1 Tax=Pedobacter endophyticus TaxID=2789740 RepID=A0A7S9L060_9SPHI|nr:hypothetical protein [Pedobacter endophyticus]QPH39829.1 hypothetical protein IZT61_00660 [Pedobacter endophyticus]